MQRVFSTADVHPRDRFDYFHNVACQQIIDHDSSPENRHGFGAEFYSGSLSDIGLCFFETTPMSVVLTLRHIVGAKNDDVFICRQFAGRLALEQDGREVLLEPGHVTLLDTRRSYSGKFLPDSRLLVLKVPRHLLEARIGPVRDISALGIEPEDGEGHLMSTFLGALPKDADKLSPLAQEMLRNQMLDLVAIALAKATDGRRPRLSSARSIVAVSVRAAIEARLTDPDVDAAAIAHAAGVSVRYANAVLAEEGTSIMHLIQSMRLERCRRALEDPQQTHRTVGDIAYGWGFSDMTHFGRKFRAAFGASPSEYRRLSQESAPERIRVTKLLISRLDVEAGH